MRLQKEPPLLVHDTQALLKQCEDFKSKILSQKHRYSGLEEDLKRLMPENMLLVTDHAQLKHLPRYLKAMMIRAERASLNPAKDKDKALAIADFEGWQNEIIDESRETFRWLFEEYRVSVFAQELGTAVPVSAKRLEALLMG